MKKFARAVALGLAMLIGGGDIQLANQQVGAGFFQLAPAAQARAVRRRPVAGPVGVGGVARRTTRRIIRRGVIIATLPAGCPYGNYYGYSLYYCGGTYYQRSGTTYVIVYF